MEERTKIYVGMDVHKDTISVAAAEPGRDLARISASLESHRHRRVPSFLRPPMPHADPLRQAIPSPRCFDES